MEASRSPRIAVHELAGHPFIVDLVEELSRRSWQSELIYCSSNLAPHGFSAVTSARIVDLRLRRPFSKYSLRRRVPQEVELAVRLCRHLAFSRPDVLVSSCVPPITALLSTVWARAHGIRTVLWIQDIQGGLARKTLADRGWLRRQLAHIVNKIEMTTAKLSAEVIAISPDFLEDLAASGVDPLRCHVQPNWGAVNRLRPHPKANSFSAEHGLGESLNFVYSGTLAKKHNPELLIELAEAQLAVPHQVVVVSEGVGAEWLAQAARERAISNLVVLPFQPFDKLNEVLGAADVLVTLLEPDAGKYSVPSKILSYLCSGTAILGSLPASNQASRIIRDAEAGIVTEPGDAQVFLRAAADLANNEALRKECGAAGRAYAELHFDVGTIASSLQSVFLPAGDLVPTPALAR